MPVTGNHIEKRDAGLTGGMMDYKAVDYSPQAICKAFGVVSGYQLSSADAESVCQSIDRMADEAKAEICTMAAAAIESLPDHVFVMLDGESALVESHHGSLELPDGDWVNATSLSSLRPVFFSVSGVAI